MASEYHLNILKQGVKVWNMWRRETQEIPDLSDMDLREVDLGGANLNGARLSKCNLGGANLSGANLDGAYLNNANLQRANLSGANLEGGEFKQADLSHADITSATLRGYFFVNTNFDSATFNSAMITHASFRNANFRNADLRAATITGCELNNVNFNSVKVGWTLFADIDLRAIRGLETAKHIGPSTIGVDTLERSEGIIPEAFLRGACLSDAAIAYARAFVSHPIQYYTCFISYSSNDEDFARRLYADLQSHNVRCWFAPHDMHIGDEIRSRIDESIRIHDKLLLILSQHSIKSTWVKKEVETAFEKEQQQGKLVLFPIKLDTTVMNTHQSWAADIRRMRHIGDFERWKEHDKYQQAFARLLSDLKATREQ